MLTGAARETASSAAVTSAAFRERLIAASRSRCSSPARKNLGFRSELVPTRR